MGNTSTSISPDRAVNRLQRLNYNQNVKDIPEPLKRVVANAIRTIPDIILQSINSKVAEKNIGTGQPVLAAPEDCQQTSEEASDKSLMELFFSIGKSLAQSDFYQEGNRAVASQVSTGCVTASLDQYASDIIAQQGNLNEKQDVLDNAQQQADALQDNLDNAEQACTQAQNTVNTLKEQAADELAENGSVSQALTDQLDRATQQLEAATQDLTAAQLAYDIYNTTVLTPAKDDVETLTDNLNNLTAEATETGRSSSLNMSVAQNALGAQSDVSAKVLGDMLGLLRALAVNVLRSQDKSQEAMNKQEEASKQSEAESKSGSLEDFLTLMALVHMLMDQGREVQSRVESEENKVEMQATIKHLQKKSDDYNEQVRKQKETEEAMGCATKILGGLVMVVSVVGAAFTGGASLAFAAVGLALTTQDIIAKETGGVSLMDEMMNPLMENVLYPAIMGIGNLLSGALQALGMDAAAAQIAGQIIGAALVVLALIGGAMVAGSLIGKVAAVVTEKVGEKLTQLLTEETIKRLSESFISQGLKRILGTVLSLSEEQLAKVGARLGIASEVGQVAEVATETTGNILVQTQEVEIAKSLTGIKLDEAIIEQLQQTLVKIAQVVAQSLAATQGMVESANSAIAASQQTNQIIANNIAAAVGA